MDTTKAWNILKLIITASLKTILIMQVQILVENHPADDRRSSLPWHIS